jgi:hypothetical protein
MITGNYRSYTLRAMVLSFKCQWIRAWGGALPCCNNSGKDCLKFCKNKIKNGKMFESGKNVHKKITVPILI